MTKKLFADAWVKTAYDNWIYVIRYDGKVRSVLRNSIFTGDTQRQLNSWRKSICTEGSPFLVHRYFDCQFNSKNVGQAWRLLNIGRNFLLLLLNQEDQMEKSY
ncbi:uncharacterized protein [Miscanthus floridulus]|uniref:uncharacterized protein n=1 Tax=Miscanthus floridulus TaxID=154761 RepID=UPI00345A98DA